MAVPKRRTSKTRKRKRRTHWTYSGVTLSECPQCHEPKRPHHVCRNCGYYRDRSVIEGEE